MTSIIVENVPRVFQSPEMSFFLFGARGTGKSTLMQLCFPDALTIDLLIANVRMKYIANPDMLIEIVQAQPNNKTIIIDEVQKVPALLSNVHALIEEKRGWRFVLTGSSARKLKAEGVDLLAGRAIKKTMYPFMACELKDHFNFDECLSYGMLPIRFASTNPAETLQTYIALYIEEEVKQEGLIRNIEPFARFLEAMSFSHASIMNITNIARDCMVKRTTVSSWLSILHDLLITFEIPIFSWRAKRELISSSKFYFFDVGVYRTLKPFAIGDSHDEINGFALEGLIAQHLVAWSDYTQQQHRLYYWRTRAGVEVDFVVYGEKGFWAIEVKNSDRIKPSDLRSLHNFSQDYPEAKLILLYRGKERLLKNNVICIPCDEFLKNLEPNNELI